MMRSPKRHVNAKSEQRYRDVVSVCFKLLISLFSYLCRRGRQRPELRGVLLGAAHVGPSLSQPHWLSKFGAEGVGDGRPSLLGQMQPLKEEWQRWGICLAVNKPLPELIERPKHWCFSFCSSPFSRPSPRCSCCSWTACGRWWTSTQQHSSSQRPIWQYWVIACGSHSSVLSSSILPNSALSTWWWATHTCDCVFLYLVELINVFIHGNATVKTILSTKCKIP